MVSAQSPSVRGIPLSSAPRTGPQASRPSQMNLPAEQVASRSTYFGRFEITGGVLENECDALFENGAGWAPELGGG